MRSSKHWQAALGCWLLARLPRLYLDSVEPIVVHVHAQEDTTTRASTQIFDDDILVHKRATTQLGELQAFGLPAGSSKQGISIERVWRKASALPWPGVNKSGTERTSFIEIGDLCNTESQPCCSVLFACSLKETMKEFGRALVIKNPHAALARCLPSAGEILENGGEC